MLYRANILLAETDEKAQELLEKQRKGPAPFPMRAGVRDALLKLEVLPTVVYEPGGVTKVAMKVCVNDDSTDGQVAAGTIINQREATTEVVAREGALVSRERRGRVMRRS